MAARIALTFSALLALCACALAGPYTDLQNQLDAAKTPHDREQIIQNSSLVQNDQKFLDYIQNDDTGQSVDDDELQQRVELAVSIRARAEQTASHGNLQSVAADIEKSPIYSDRGERETTNWLGRALDRLRNFQFKQPEATTTSMPSGIVGPWIIYFAWIVLGAVLLVFVIIGLKRVDFAKLRSTKKKSSGGLLDEDDPDRTLDEWLVLADQLEKEGRYREAVRSLYLACLLKIDEARIARFDRGQTNWEHLARIEASPRLPAGMEFRSPTKAFDRIWYGYQVQGAEDVARFRAWYRGIVDATRQVAA